MSTNPKEKQREYNRVHRTKYKHSPEKRAKWREEGRASYQRRKDGINARRREKAYGLAPGEFEQMLAMQGGVCAACSSVDPEWYRGWQVDHDHQTGEVRGILCHPCNAALGFTKDSAERLERLIQYLTRT